MIDAKEVARLIAWGRPWHRYEICDPTRPSTGALICRMTDALEAQQREIERLAHQVEILNRHDERRAQTLSDVAAERDLADRTAAEQVKHIDGLTAQRDRFEEMTRIAADSRDVARVERDLLRAEVDRLRPVVEAIDAIVDDDEKVDSTFCDEWKRVVTAVAAYRATKEKAPVTEEAECPGPDCVMCSGAACNKCGAGCWNNAADFCEHASDERHEDPSTEKS